MKFVALGNSPNISASRHGANKMSMQLDSRGLPHICWLENKNGHNEMHYKFWDGIQWTYHNNPMVGWTEEELITSNNALVLGDSEKPNIVFSRRLPSSKSVITMASPYEESWILDELEVDYDVKWVGIVKYDYSVWFSSSSSSSTSLSSNSSSSSTSNSSSSSIDSSSSSSNSSSSSKDSSSSSSNSSSSNSSSSSKDSSSSSSNSSSSSSSNSSSSSSSSSNGYSSSSSSIGYTSSSSSIDSSSSSSSSNGYTSSSSSIDSSSSSSTSNGYTSSSSSIDSSSSSFGDDARKFVVTLSSNNILRIYGITSNGWNLLTEKSTFSDNGYVSAESFKIVQCSKYIAIMWLSVGAINYNFFNINDEEWKYSASQSISVDGLVCSGIDGYGVEDDGILTFVSVEKDGTEIKIVNRTISSEGVVSSFGASLIESENSTVYGNNNFVSSGYTKIAVVADNGLPVVIAIGARTTKYTFDGSLWSKEYVSLDGMGNGFYIDDFTLQNYNGLRILLSVNGKDVYFLKEDNDLEAFPMISPEFTILNSQRLFVATWEDIEIRNGSEIRCTWYCRVGDILREGLTRVNVIVADEEDPECYTSSSSSSSTSSSSSRGYSETSTSYGESISTDGDSESSLGYSSLSSPGDSGY